MTSPQNDDRSASPRRPRGRPRDPELDRNVRHAALQLLAEVGYDRMGMEAIAARAGVAKATLYRRWTDKAELVFDAVREYEPNIDALPADTGTLRGDLLAYLPNMLVFRLFESEQASILSGIVQGMRTVPGLEEYMRTGVVGATRHQSEIIIERAIARGELQPAARSIPFFHDVAPSLVIARTLLTFDVVGDAAQQQIVDGILIPLLRSAT